MNSKRIVVIGGGISGLALAHRISELSRELGIPARVTVLEAGPRLGGVICSQKKGEFLFELGPDSFISEKPEVTRLAKRLGFENQLISTQDEYRQSYIVRSGKLIPVPKGLYLLAPTDLKAFLASPLVSWAGKLRMASEYLVPAKTDLEDESLGQFVRRRFGREALRWIGEPMVAGIYSADPERLSLEATFPRFREMEREYGSILRGFQKKLSESAKTKSPIRQILSEASGPRYSLFLSFRDGMSTLVDQLVRHSQAVSFRLNTRVELIRRSDEVWNIGLESKETLQADSVCLALPAHQAGLLISSFDAGLSQLLNDIPYESVATVNVAVRRDAIRRPIRGFGFVVPRAEKRHLIGCTFSNMKFGGRAPESHMILRAFVGGAFQRELLQKSDQAIESAVFRDLSELLEIDGEPENVVIRRAPKSMPQYEVGHLARVARIEEKARRHPHFYLTGNAFHGIGLPDCVREAEKTAELVMAQSVEDPATPSLESRSFA